MLSQAKIPGNSIRLTWLPSSSNSITRRSVHSKPASPKRLNPKPTSPKSITYLFTGQGAQYPGMGKDLAKEWKVAREVFEEVDEALNMTLSKKMFDGAPMDLRPTAIAQPAIIAQSIATYEVIKSIVGVDPIPRALSLVGHSVGEISALVVSGAISVSAAVKFAHQRGIYMQACAPIGEETGMAAFFPISLEQANLLCQEASQITESILDIACINSPKQIVLSGSQVALNKAIELARQGYTGDRCKASILDVSAPFHSSYMKKSEIAIRKQLDSMKIRVTSAPIISNMTVMPMRTPEEIRENVTALTSLPVRFSECVEKSISMITSQPSLDVIPSFIELGPQQTLTNFVAQTNPSVQTQFLGSAESITKFFSNNDNLIAKSML